MATIPDTLSAEMWALLLCANGALEEAGVPVGKAFLNPGATVPDDDCCAGQLAVRVIERYPSRTFPAIDTTASNCNPLFRSEEHTSELQSLMRISYAVFCLTNKNKTKTQQQ